MCFCVELFFQLNEWVCVCLNPTLIRCYLNKCYSHNKCEAGLENSSHGDIWYFLLYNFWNLQVLLNYLSLLGISQSQVSQSQVIQVGKRKQKTPPVVPLSENNLQHAVMCHYYHPKVDHSAITARPDAFYSSHTAPQQLDNDYRVQ